MITCNHSNVDLWALLGRGDTGAVLQCLDNITYTFSEWISQTESGQVDKVTFNLLSEIIGLDWAAVNKLVKIFQLDFLESERENFMSLSGHLLGNDVVEEGLNLFCGEVSWFDILIESLITKLKDFFWGTLNINSNN
jgi:hypothetical protein